MSRYTTEVRYICESLCKLEASAPYNQVNAIIAKAAPQIFEEYEIFDENYRQTLNAKILKHFYMREIGAETVGLWKLWLNTKMEEIMPLYNQLYKSALLQFNPLYDTDITTERTVNGSEQGTENEKRDYSNSATGHETVTQEGNGDATSTNRGSTTADSTRNSTGTSTVGEAANDTPQGGLADVENLKYLTRYGQTNSDDANSDVSRTKNVNEGSNTDVTHTDSKQENASNVINSGIEGAHKGKSIQTIESYIEHVQGVRGGDSYAKRLQDFRATFLNIDMMVINELNCLFLGLWE